LSSSAAVERTTAAGSGRRDGHPPRRGSVTLDRRFEGLAEATPR